MSKIIRNKLTPNDFNSLTKLVGWGQLPLDQISKALENSVYVTALYLENELIGMGRLIGDKSISYYIKDLVIAPKYQGKGYGTLLIKDMIKFIKENTPKNYKFCLELMSAEGKEPFYERLGFERTPSKSCGAGMFMIVENN